MKQIGIFRPKLIDCLQDYSSEKFFKDLTAGITVGIVALPLAMAFGIASGVTPQAGIFTAVIAGIIISALGGSKVQIGGPTGAFVVIVYGIIEKYGLGNLYICTVMAGCMLLIMGFAKLGTLIKFIPYPVTSGFTTGIAVTIFSTQIADFLGLRISGKLPGDFVDKMQILGQNLHTFHWPTFALAAGSIILIIFWPKQWGKRIPGSIVAMICGTAAMWYFNISGVETIGTKFHGIPKGLPTFQSLDVSWGNIQHLIMPAVTIALLAGIESLLSAVVADGLIDDRHDSNQELLAQGIANLVCPFFGGIPATGAIARTATNIRNGANTPIAGIIHALVLLIILLVAAPLAKFIPLATLSAVLIIVAYNMGEWHEFTRLKNLPKSDSAVLVAVFTLTVVLDLPRAVMIGMVMASFLLIRRLSETTHISMVDESNDSDGPQHSIIGKEVPQGVLIYRIFGAFFFGAADKLEIALKRAHENQKVIILHINKVMAMDATGLYALESLLDRLQEDQKHLILCGPHEQPYMLLEKANFFDKLGRKNVVADMDEALGRAREILNQQRN
jgi:SulP family sulfate permease